MQRKHLLLALILSLSGCRKGYEVCVSNAAQAQFDCSYSKGAAETISYADSVGMVVYSIHDFQSIADYCADKSLPLPTFTACSSGASGFTCGSVSVPIVSSDGYIGLSEIDNTALMATCGITK